MGRKLAVKSDSVSILDLIKIEGIPNCTGVGVKNYVWNGTPNVVISNCNASLVGRAVFVESLYLTSTINIKVAILIQPPIASINRIFYVTVTPSGITIPIKQLYRSFGVDSTTFNFQVRIDAVLTPNPTTDAFTFDSGMIFISITDDLYVNFSNRILWLGDSISDGTGCTKTAEMYPFMFKNYYASKKVNLSNQSIPGTQSNDHYTFTQSGKYDTYPWDMVVLSIGVNDASQNIIPSKVVDNYTAIISYFKQANNQCKFLIIAGTPVENDTLYAKLSDISTALMDLKNESNGIFAVSCLSAFDRKNTSYYATSDTTGNHIHPNGSGNLSIYNVIKPYLDSVTIL